MNFENQPRTDADDVLLNVGSAIDYCIQKGYLETTKPCANTQCSTNQMKIFCNKKYMNGYGYKKEYNILSGLFIDRQNIILSKYFRSIYKWCENLSEKNVLRNCSISKFAYQQVKKHFFLY